MLVAGWSLGYDRIMTITPVNPIDIEALSDAEALSLLAFYRDAGVDWMVEDEPVDHKAVFAAQRTSPAIRAPAEQAPSAPSARAEGRSRPVSPPAQAQSARPMTVPDDQAIAAARKVAAACQSIPDLQAAMAAFDGCNLKTSARSTAFIDGNIESDILVIGPVASAEDDREGVPFSGPAGQLLDRMLKAIDLTRDDVLLSLIVPWRPPGSRVPRADETELCRPFTERLIALARSRAILMLGNHTVRTLIDPQGSIHSLRGQWFDLQVAGGASVPAIATFHPADLIQAPLNKKLAWRDLLMFRMALAPSA